MRCRKVSACWSTQKPGTTRDFVEVRAEWDGIPITLIDTAGERDDKSEPEAQGAGSKRYSGADLHWSSSMEKSVWGRKGFYRGAAVDASSFDCVEQDRSGGLFANSRRSDG